MKDLFKIIIDISILSLLGYVGGILLIGVLASVYEVWEVFAVFLAIFLGIFLVIYIISFIKVYRTTDKKRELIAGFIAILWLIAMPFVWYYFQYWYTPFVWFFLLIIFPIPNKQKNKTLFRQK